MTRIDRLTNQFKTDIPVEQMFLAFIERQRTHWRTLCQVRSARVGSVRSVSRTCGTLEDAHAAIESIAKQYPSRTPYTLIVDDIPCTEAGRAL